MFQRDKELTCVECSTQFTFSAADQEFYTARGFQEPKRCPRCRQQRRGSQPNAPDRQMFAVVCSSCGADTFVPFQPRQDRPVYCDACFAKVRPQRSSFA